MSKVRNGVAWDNTYRAGNGGNRSFVEVVKGNQIRYVKKETKVMEKVVEMSWSSKDNEDEWLLKCVAGILKEISSVSSVNHWLNSMGISFSSNYLGNKRIPSTFDSEMERDGFVKSRFLWDDIFSSVVNGMDPPMPHNLDK